MLLYQLCFQITCDIAKVFSSRKLFNHHYHELDPSAIGSEILAKMINFSMVVEFMSVNKRSNLTKDCVILLHGSDLLVLYGFFVEIIITQRAL